MEENTLLVAAPPNNPDAEKTVLGAMLQSAVAANMACENLEADDFYTPEYKEVFQAMKELHTSGSPVDIITTGNELKRRGTYESIGSAKFLLQAASFVPTTANVHTYIQIVQEKSTLRKLINACKSIQKDCYAQADPLSDILNTAERSIFDIVMKRSGTDTLKPLSQVLMTTFDQMEQLSRLKGKLAGIPSGLYDLDRMLTCFHGGEFIVVGARPAMGKTAMALSIADFAARKAHRSIAFFSMEMPAEQIALRMLCSSAQVNMQRVRSGMLADEEWIKIGDAINELSSCQIYIDDTAGVKPSQLRSRCRRLMMEKGLDLIIIDYLGLMSSDKIVDSRQLEVSDISRSLKSIALELKIPVLACAQLSRSPANRDNKRPMLSDLRDSGSIEQDADVVLFLHREGYYQRKDKNDPTVMDNEGEIIVSKQRNGPVGTVKVEWQAEFARYTNRPDTLVAQYAE